MNTNPKAKITIIGAGISGLIAAYELEQAGYSPLIIEAQNSVGGRVQTDTVSGYQLDRGFQVLLEAYPLAQKYLDYEALQLQPLQDGALLFDLGQRVAFGDPRRNTSFLLSTLLTSKATLSDKWKIFTLTNELKTQTIDELFQKENTTTMEYLKKQKFSDKIINSFFKPFFSGIFLENELQTSSRMFEYVFKMFATGSAVIPKKGMGAIPQQLRGKLTKTEFIFDTKVKSVSGTEVHLENGDQLSTDFTIVAANPEHILLNYVSSLSWRTCDTLYFTTREKSFNEPIIGLNTNKDSLVNNLFFSTSIKTETKGSDELLSVTIVKNHALSTGELIAKVTNELAEDFGITDVSFLKHYEIPQALPSLEDIQSSREAGEHLITERVALAGDYLLNGSLNAAMESGEKAAKAAIKAVQSLPPL